MKAQYGYNNKMSMKIYSNGAWTKLANRKVYDGTQWRVLKPHDHIFFQGVWHSIGDFPPEPSNFYSTGGLQGITSYDYIERGENTNWVQVVSGWNRVFLLNTSGEIWEFVNNALTRVGTASNWTKIMAGNLSFAAINANGDLYTWGSGYKGMLGTGNESDQINPTQIGIGTSWIDAAFGKSTLLAVDSEGVLHTCGYGCLGRSVNGYYHNTKDVNLGIVENTSGVTKVAAGRDDKNYIIQGGSLWAFGRSEYLGIKDYRDSFRDMRTVTPIPVPEVPSCVDITVGADVTAAVTGDGCLYTWGRYDRGQIGRKYYSSGVEMTFDYFCKVPFPLLPNGDESVHVIKASAKNEHLVVLTDTGDLWACGGGAGGRLGGGHYKDQLRMVPVGGGQHWTDIAAGEWFTVALKTSY